MSTLVARGRRYGTGKYRGGFRLYSYYQMASFGMEDLFRSLDLQFDVERKRIPLKTSNHFLTHQRERDTLLPLIRSTLKLRREQFQRLSIGLHKALVLRCNSFKNIVCFSHSGAPCLPRKPPQTGITHSYSSMFTCKCGWLLFDPCSLPCGHTLCRSCAEGAGFCLFCGLTLSEKVATNIFLANLLWKWFPREYKAASLKKEGRKFVEENLFEKAVTVLCEALKLTPNDHIALLYRSEANLKLDNKREALDDAQLAVKLNQSCGQAYFRLGAAFAAMGQLDDAINAYQTCLELEPDDISLFKSVVESLDKLLAPPDPNEIDFKSHNSREALEAPTDFGLGSSVTTGSVSHESPSTSFTKSSSLPPTLDGTDDSTASGADLQGSPTKISSAKEASQSSGHGSEDSGDSASRQGPSLAVEGGSALPLLGREERPCGYLSEMDGGCYSSSDLNEDTSGSNESSANDSGSDEDGIVRATSKRFRSPSPPVTAEAGIDSKRPRRVKEADHELDIEDFECKLCFNVLFQPVTTPCGHVFCKECLERCLDHKAVCPNCRASLEGYLVDRRRVVTEVVEKTIEKYFPLDYRERKSKYEERMAKLARVGEDEEVEVPIFVCAMVLPTIQCPLHVFEPRYRLMLRECLESGSKKFGMCIETEREGFSDVGTILEVKCVRYLEDGRAIIDAVGGRRFSVVSRGMRDGFDVAKVKYFDDLWPEEVSESEMVEFNARYTLVYRQLSNYVSNLHPAERECIFNALGPLPQLDPSPKDYPNGISWLWWALAALPLNNHAKEVLLRSRSLSDRLCSIQRFLRFLIRMNRQNARPANNDLSGSSSGTSGSHPVS